MLTMDVRHPDIEKFIEMKSILHPKLLEYGIKEPYLVTGANVSVKINDDFMMAVKDNKDFLLKYPVDSNKPNYFRTIKAKKLWDLIVEKATFCAEPGLLMWDNILKFLPANCYPEFYTQSTNPCSEIPLSAR